VREPEVPEEPAQAPDLARMIAEAVEDALHRREVQRNPPQAEEQAQEEEVLAQELAHDDEQEQGRYMRYLLNFRSCILPVSLGEQTLTGQRVGCLAWRRLSRQ
jgi:hypothetical protein